MGSDEIKVKIIDVRVTPWKEVFDNYDVKTRTGLLTRLYTLYFWKKIFPRLTMVRYVQIPEDYPNVEAVAYFCGLLSSSKFRKVDIADTEGHFFPACIWDSYHIGELGKPYGYPTFDKFMRYLRKRAYRRKHPSIFTRLKRLRRSSLKQG